METIRAFISVDIGDEIRGRLDELQRKLKKIHANVRWANPGNMHLTLVFLGDMETDRMNEVKKILDHAVGERSSFELVATGTGYFGKPDSPRVVWVGLADCPALQALQRRIAQELADAEIGFDNKPFSPHLTLGRIKGIDRHTGPLLERIERYGKTAFGNTTIDRVELIRSVLTPRGAEYSVLHSALLQSLQQED